MLATVSLTLKKCGFRVLSATTAEEAIQMSQEFAGKIHLLLTDVIMPGMNGPDLAITLLERRKELRVILMTAYADRKLFASGEWEILRKPFTAATLSEKVNAVLQIGDTEEWRQEAQPA